MKPHAVVSSAAAALLEIEHLATARIGSTEAIERPPHSAGMEEKV